MPDTDFADAFRHIADQAISVKASAFLLAGDLFDRPQVEPPHLRQAQEILGKLKAAHIPVIAVAGNHDKALLNSDAPTWLDYLADDELLILLATRFGPDGPVLERWTRERRRGAWLDLNGVRFVGAGYLGAATPHKVRQIVEHLEPGPPQVLLLHAGPDYFVGEGGGFSGEDLALIRERVCYLALGHIHKPMLHEDWACNPGSPENCDMNESLYDRDKNGNPVRRGYAWVEIDPSSGKPLRRLEVRSNPRRPVLNLDLDCTPFSIELQNGAAALEQAAGALIARNDAPIEAAVVLRLTGKLNLGRLALDLDLAARNIERVANIKAAFLDVSGVDLSGPGAALGPVETTLSREEIERASIRGLVEEEHLWGLDGEQDAVADLFFELKEGVRANKSVDELAELVQVSPLTEKIRASAMASADTIAGEGGRAQPHAERSA